MFNISTRSNCIIYLYSLSLSFPAWVRTKKELEKQGKENWKGTRLTTRAHERHTHTHNILKCYRVYNLLSSLRRIFFLWVTGTISGVGNYTHCCCCWSLLSLETPVTRNTCSRERSFFLLFFFCFCFFLCNKKKIKKNVWHTSSMKLHPTATRHTLVPRRVISLLQLYGNSAGSMKYAGEVKVSYTKSFLCFFFVCLSHF